MCVVYNIYYIYSRYGSLRHIYLFINQQLPYIYKGQLKLCCTVHKYHEQQYDPLAYAPNMSIVSVLGSPSTLIHAGTLVHHSCIVSSNNGDK